MDALGVKQNELARRLGVSPNTVGRWLAGGIELDLARLETISDALGCSFADLAAGAEAVAEEGMAYGMPIRPLAGPTTLLAPDQLRLPGNSGTQFLVALTVDELRIIALYRDGKVRIEESSNEQGR